MSAISSFASGPSGLSAYRSEVIKSVFNELSAQNQLAKFEKLGLGASVSSVDELLTAAAKTDLAKKPVELFDLAFDGLVRSYPNRLRFNLSADAIKGLVEEIKQRLRGVGDAVAAIPAGQHTFENTILPLAERSAATDPLRSNVTFMAHVSTDKAIRDIAHEADQELSAFDVEQQMRLDVYQSVLAYQNKHESLKPVDQRLLDRIIRDFRRNGLHLDAENREKITKIQTKMSDLSIKFSQNLGEDSTFLALTEEELTGFPKDCLERLAVIEPAHADGKKRLKLTLKYPDYYPAMKYISVEATRQAVEKAYNSRCFATNTPILEEVIQMRAEKAHILGFKTHAQFVLDVRMAKTPETVTNFLNDLSNKLNPLVEADRAALKALKKAEKEKNGQPYDGKLHPWDIAYYSRMREETEYEVNHEEIKQYFPLEVVTAGLLDIYQELLGVHYEEEKEPHVWHPEVKQYRVTDKASGEFLGHFYLDLHPRDGKYGHAACFDVQSSCVHRFTGQQVRQPSAAACVCNFTAGTPEKPSLLTHDEVETFFHEFGHVMHHICSRASYAIFSGLSCEQDFVEAPSQMLENWCWEKESLLRLSGHVADHSKKLPEALLQKLVAARNANAGLFNKRQLVFGIFDQTIHTMDKADTAAIYAQVLKAVMDIDATPGTNMGATFGHLLGGYDATYYGYMWSEVYAADMFFTRFKKEGISNPAVGMDYRKMILEPGFEHDSMENLVKFLGRAPQLDAFLQLKGLNASV